MVLACLSRILREILLERSRVKPIGAIVEFASVEKMKEVRKLRRCYRAKVVARSTIGTA